MLRLTPKLGVGPFDEPQIREIVSTVLEGEGCRVLLAGGGEEALALVEHEQPMAIVANVGMPRLDGVRLTAVLRELRLQTLRPRSSAGGG